jgi:hypothetical protein
MVCIGDSLSQGFKSGAIFEPHLSMPAIVAYEMGLPKDAFRFASFNGQGGLPINIEYLLHKMDHQFGKDVNWWELPFAAISLRQWMDEIEDYWERGGGFHPLRYKGPYHNLAVWGFEIQDSWQVTAEMCLDAARQSNDNWIRQVPNDAMLRTALRVLNPSHSKGENDEQATQLSRVKELADDGGIENLIVFLGANNVLGSVVSLEVRESTPKDLAEPFPPNRTANVYTPEHFKRLMETLMTQLAGIGNIRNIFFGTTPSVTIPPVSNGVGGRLASDLGLQSPYGAEDHPEWYRRYFKYYTRPWIDDDHFSERDPHLKAKEIIEIDRIILQYKHILQDLVGQHRAQGASWHVIDLHWTLERMAFRRYQESDAPSPPEWTAYQMPEEYMDLKLDTRFLKARQGRRTAGGLISLDGIHPTTVGYGIAAQEVMDVMHNAGVAFFERDGKTLRDTPRVDYNRLIRKDTLIQGLPLTLDDLWRKLQIGDSIGDLFQRAFAPFRRGD